VLRKQEVLGKFQIVVHQTLKSESTRLAGMKSLVSDAGHVAFLTGFCTLKLIIQLQCVEASAFRWRTHLQGLQIDKADKYVQGKERCNSISILIENE